MPSRQLFTAAALHLHHHHPLLTPLLASTCTLLLLLLLCLRNRNRNRTSTKRTSPSSDPPHRFSYALLRHATNSFSTLLGHGGFGPVFSGSLPPASRPVAVKLMDSASLQGEREFHNELFFASRLRSPHVVPAIGFSSDDKRRRFLLVYDLMHNGNLHDALLRRKCPELLHWNHRFALLLDIAKGIDYLHSCHPPIIHGDIKPSNILLDRSFSAKIGDFGLARLKTEPLLDQVAILGVESDNTRSLDRESDTDGGSEASPKMGASKFHQASGSGPAVKDYVIDWIGKEVKKERPKGEWVADASCSGTTMGKKKNKKKTKKSSKKLEWWESMDEGISVSVSDKRRPAREWWKDEYSQELAKKKKKKQQQSDGDHFWLDGMSGDLRTARRNSYDSAASGEVAKSGGASSTPSMRGTMFYVAPEYGYSGDASEKCDVYSFGVLLLVIISGRRPLQVMAGSPLSEFKRANLVSWARHCARNGKLLELVDQSIQSLDKEQALLCIKVALLCLLKSPARRPSMKEVVGMLSGNLESPQLPAEYSRLPFNSRKQGR